MEGKKYHKVEHTSLNVSHERRRKKSGSNTIFSAIIFNRLKRFRKFFVGILVFILVILVYTVILPANPTLHDSFSIDLREQEHKKHDDIFFVEDHIDIDNLQNGDHQIPPSPKPKDPVSSDHQETKPKDPVSRVVIPPPEETEQKKELSPDKEPKVQVIHEVDEKKEIQENPERNESGQLLLEVSKGQSEDDVPREEGMTCRLPNLNPFDESVMKFLTSPEIIECENKDFPLLFGMDFNSTLVSVNSPEEFGYEECCFFDLTRKSKDDDEVIIAEECTPISDSRTKIPSENIVITCKDTNSQLWSDVDIFGLPILIPQLENYLEEKRSEKMKTDSTFSGKESDNYNVVILGLDAVSHMNFQRTMPLTRNYLLKDLEAVSFDGYMKVGENTFPNAMATLTGKSVNELKDICWSSDEDYLDSCPFIWRNFSSHSLYRTSYGEDAPVIGTFNYLKKGFNSPPVDYYLRPLMLSQDLYIGHENLLNANVCYGPRLAFQVLLDYMKNFAFTMNHSRRYFQYIWGNSLFHDVISGPILGDKLLLDTLQWFQDGGYMNETIFILMSDHGMRWGDLRETFQGRIEERMPLLYIVFPESFRQKYKRGMRNIRDNKKRLTTHFDLHETLMDILYLQTKLTDEKIESRERTLFEGSVPRGLSLFLPIPKNRTCGMAQVDEHYCVCSSLKPIDIRNNAEVEEGAARIVEEINSKLDGYKDCAKLDLAEIISAHIFIQDGSMDDSKVEGSDEQSKSMTSKTTFEITIKTLPGLALFEASVSKQGNNGTFSVQQISRANLYGRQSQCVTESSVKMFCYCIN